jgi:hypothetical protein
MGTSLIPLDLADEALMKLVRTLPTSWSGNAYYHTLTETEQKVLERLVTVGRAAIRVDIHVTEKRRSWLGRVKSDECRIVYESRGFDWKHETVRRGQHDSGLSPEKTTFGAEVFEFKLTNTGEQLRQFLNAGLFDQVRFIVDNRNPLEYPFKCQRVKWESVQQQQRESESGKTIAAAAAQATAIASVGDTITYNHIHVPAQPAPVVNVMIPKTESRPIQSKTTINQDEKKSRNDAKLAILRGLIQRRHYGDESHFIDGSEPITFAEIQTELKKANSGKLPRGWTKGTISRHFKHIFHKNGHTQYVDVVSNQKEGLEAFLRDPLERKEKRTDGNQSVNRFTRE